MSQYEEGPLQSTNRRCTDTLFCMLFFGCWIVNFVVFGVAYGYGDINRLVMATDYEGNTCGEDGRGGLGFYPRLTDDVIVAMQSADSCIADATTGQLGDCEVTLFTVCVDACPAAGDIVCDYQRAAEEGLTAAKKQEYAAVGDGCWVTPMAQQDPPVVNRCVPAIDQISSETTWECDGIPIATSATMLCEGLLTETTTTKFNTTAGSQVLFSSLVKSTYTVGKYLEDAETSAGTIFAYGLGLAMVRQRPSPFSLPFLGGFSACPLRP